MVCRDIDVLVHHSNTFMIALNDEMTWTFMEGGLSSATIFMLVLGTLSMGGYVTQYVSNGITRRDYFYGKMLTGMSVAVLMTAVVLLFSLLSNGFISWFNLEENLSVRIIDGGVAADYGNLAWLRLLLLLNLFFFLGWFISAGFYRHWLFGSINIIIAVYIGIVGDHLMSTLLATAIYCIIAIAIVIFILKKMTKRIEVKP
ncbi:hypothetical protein [Geomicrobium sp. JCM 19037]|uniref:hypothetical protein n=1 Tax=Geomicrobium sp. JCM 19037 TaxID=1460634 RepID=UPI0005A873C0|nr:hypothetical protein [Geomicrobium sp. JCM 19037]